MADDGVIAAYLRELRSSVARLADADDIVAEAEDHLVEAAGRLSASHATRADAESEAVARFGSANLIAHVCLAESQRGPAVPTVHTRRAGLAAFAAPLLLIVGQLGNVTIDKRAVSHGIAVFVLTMSFPALVFGLWGLRKRHGGLGRVGVVAFVLAVISPALSMAAGWGAAGALALLLCVAALAFSIEMLRASVLPVVPLVLFAGGPIALLVLGVAACGVTLAGGDAGHPHPALVLAPVAATAIGLCRLGWHLWREPAVDGLGRGPLATA
jgi:hypothetical protein